jgi:fructose-specific phosphotransferase system IIC component
MRDVATMNLITPGRIYGVIAAFALLAVFVVPPQIELSGTLCGVLSFAQKGCEVGIQAVFRGAIIYCLFAGYLVSRILDRKPVVSAFIAPFVAAIAAVLFALPLCFGLSAAFY